MASAAAGWWSFRPERATAAAARCPPPTARRSLSAVSLVGCSPRAAGRGRLVEHLGELGRKLGDRVVEFSVRSRGPYLAQHGPDLVVTPCGVDGVEHAADLVDEVGLVERGGVTGLFGTLFPQLCGQPFGEPPCLTPGNRLTEHGQGCLCRAVCFLVVRQPCALLHSLQEILQLATVCCQDVRFVVPAAIVVTHLVLPRCSPSSSTMGLEGVSVWCSASPELSL